MLASFWDSCQNFALGPGISGLERSHACGTARIPVRRPERRPPVFGRVGLPADTRAGWLTRRREGKAAMAQALEGRCESGTQSITFFSKIEIDNPSTI